MTINCELFVHAPADIPVPTLFTDYMIAKTITPFTAPRRATGECLSPPPAAPASGVHFAHLVTILAPEMSQMYGRKV